MAKNKRHSNPRNDNNMSDKLYKGLKKTGEIVLAATEVIVAVGGAMTAYENLKGKGKK